MKKYNVCWSGGVDSTFIITQLSRYPVKIKPFYIKGQTFRLSEPQELLAIESIREELIADSRTKADILPVEIINKDDERIKDREVIKAHRHIYIDLLSKYKEKNGGVLPPAGSQQIYADGAFISPQYIACESLARSIGENIEIGLLKDDFEGNMTVFKSYPTCTRYDSETERYLLYLPVDNPDSNIYELFKHLFFPIAGQKMYKRDVWKWFEDYKYENIRKKTNFCQAPVIYDDGTWEPCGTCTACIGVIREGVLDPFTDEGIERYKDYEKNSKNEPERFRLKGF